MPLVPVLVQIDRVCGSSVLSEATESFTCGCQPGHHIYIQHFQVDPHTLFNEHQWQFQTKKCNDSTDRDSARFLSL